MPWRGACSVQPRTRRASFSVPLEEKHQLVTNLSGREAAARASLAAARAAAVRSDARAQACGGRIVAGDGGGRLVLQLGGEDVRLGGVNTALMVLHVLGGGLGEVAFEPLAAGAVDYRPEEAAPLLAHAEGPTAFDLAGQRADFGGEGGADAAGEEVAGSRPALVCCDGVGPFSDGLEASRLPDNRFDDAVVLRQRARRPQVAQLCGGLLDEFGCELDRCVPGLVGNMLRSELPMGSLRVEADEGAFGVRQSGVEGGGGGGLLEGRRPIAMRGQEGLFADGRRVARHT